eukprot:TRINITY_DN8621_c0_g1_i1.p1 TRINITY_DN8621_c0_g1~~TRINITY_DN8621_c0_g1_i1.p1  ORF type:complete len:326 (+),score=91.10 TRINITY_DN8621_c0_g1_i1:359-1336(+)
MQLTYQVDKLGRENLVLVTEKMELSRELESLREQLTKVQNSYDSLLDMKNLADKQCGQYKKELDTLKDNMEAQDRNMNQGMKEIVKIKEKSNERKKKNKDLKGQVMASQTLNSKYENDIQELTEKYDELSKDYQEVSGLFNKEREQNIQLKKENDKMKLKVQDTNKENERLRNELENVDISFDKRMSKLRHECTDIKNKYIMQLKVIDHHIGKKSLMAMQLAEEVKRNGELIKQNGELRSTIKMQQQIMVGLSIDEEKESIRILEENKYLENEQNVTNHTQHNDDNPSNEQINTQSRGWLASIPIVGRFWRGNNKTYKRTFEVIV